MIRLKITLKAKTNIALKLNYKNKLRRLCNEIIKTGNKHQSVSDNTNKKNKIFFSPLFCCNYEVNDDEIIFKDNVNWYITTNSYELILQIVQGFYIKEFIKIGKTELEVVGLEFNQIPEPESKKKNIWKKKYIYNISNETIHESTSIM